VTRELTHVDASGAARMVDVSGKAVTVRTASASGSVRVSADVVALLRGRGVPKGDALAVARDRRHPGGQAHARPRAAVPSDRHPRVTVDLRSRHGRRSRRPYAPPTAPASRWRRSPASAVAALALVDRWSRRRPAAVISDVQVESKTGGKPVLEPASVGGEHGGRR
jgi:cyclic pyranopterin phosphate synthase